MYIYSINLNIPRYPILLIVMFKNSSFFESVYNLSSPIHYTVTGLPQGSCLSSIMFYLFISDLPKIKILNTYSPRIQGYSHFLT